MVLSHCRNIVGDAEVKIPTGDATDSEQSPTRILVVEDDFLIAMQTETARAMPDSGSSAPRQLRKKRSVLPGKNIPPWR